MRGVGGFEEGWVAGFVDFLEGVVHEGGADSGAAVEGVDADEGQVPEGFVFGMKFGELLGEFVDGFAPVFGDRFHGVVGRSVGYFFGGVVVGVGADPEGGGGEVLGGVGGSGFAGSLGHVTGRRRGCG